jgi:hypothetical protein
MEKMTTSRMEARFIEPMQCLAAKQLPEGEECWQGWFLFMASYFGDDDYLFRERPSLQDSRGTPRWAENPG